MTSGDEEHVSPDGAWRWDPAARRWLPTGAGQTPQYQAPQPRSGARSSRRAVLVILAVVMVLGYLDWRFLEFSIQSEFPGAVEADTVVQPTCSAPERGRGKHKLLEVRGCVAEFRGTGARVVVSHHVGNVEAFVGALIKGFGLATPAGMICAGMVPSCADSILEYAQGPVVVSDVEPDGTFRVRVPRRRYLRSGDLNVTVLLPGGRRRAIAVVKVRNGRGSYVVPPMFDWHPDPSVTVDGHSGRVRLTPFPEASPSRPLDEPASSPYGYWARTEHYGRIELGVDDDGGFVRSALPADELDLRVGYEANNGVRYEADGAKVPAISPPLSLGGRCSIDTGSRLIRFRQHKEPEQGLLSTCPWTDGAWDYRSYARAWLQVCRDQIGGRCPWSWKQDTRAIARLAENAVLDLGSVQPISEVMVLAPGPDPIVGTFAVSDDGTHWREVGQLSGAGANARSIAMVEGPAGLEARYLRFSGFAFDKFQEIAVY